MEFFGGQALVLVGGKEGGMEREGREGVREGG